MAELTTTLSVWLNDGIATTQEQWNSWSPHQRSGFLSVEIKMCLEGEFNGTSRDILESYVRQAIENAAYKGSGSNTFSLDQVSKMDYADLENNGLLASK